MLPESSMCANLICSFCVYIMRELNFRTQPLFATVVKKLQLQKQWNWCVLSYTRRLLRSLNEFSESGARICFGAQKEDNFSCKV